MKRFQSYSYWLLIAYLVIGYMVPQIGVIALICMLAPVMLAPFQGRAWCGNYCPRGSFYDHVLSKFSPKKPIPAFLRSQLFRILVVLLIFASFSIQLHTAWGDPKAIGMVFIRIILITTVVGILLGLTINQRTWCSFCPMGTMASWISAIRKPLPLSVSNACVDCKLCSKACSLQLKPYTAKGSEGGFTDPDCIKCGRCVTACPKKAILLSEVLKK